MGEKGNHRPCLLSGVGSWLTLGLVLLVGKWICFQRAASGSAAPIRFGLKKHHSYTSALKGKTHKEHLSQSTTILLLLAEKK